MWRLRGLYAKICGPYQNKSDRVVDVTGALSSCDELSRAVGAVYDQSLELRVASSRKEGGSQQIEPVAKLSRVVNESPSLHRR